MNFLKDENSNYRWSVISLFLSNAVTVIGVLFFGWDVIQILFLYWAEMGVIGFYALFKIVARYRWLAILAVPEFILSYFAFVAGLLVATGAVSGFGGNNSGDFRLSQEFFSKILNTFTTVRFGIISLFFSHGVSFVVNFINKKEYLNKDFDIFSKAFERIYLMVGVITVGAFIANKYTTTITLILLVLAKTAVDFYSHRKEHRAVLQAPVFAKYAELINKRTN